LEVLGQELFVEFGLTVNTLAYWRSCAGPRAFAEKIQVEEKGHSGELETSLMLHMAPQWVIQRDIPQGVLGVHEEGPTEGIKRYVNMKEHSLGLRMSGARAWIIKPGFLS
jgi:creatinine amidohydrolase/Fe(II)-dependent formamide hydrolase-like protein